MITAPFGDGDCVEKEWDSSTIKFELFLTRDENKESKTDVVADQLS
jgi:hypothetical protein